MIFARKISKNHALETQLTFMPKQLAISFAMHYSDGKFIDHPGFYLNLLVFGLLFEFNIYDTRHAEEEND